MEVNKPTPVPEPCRTSNPTRFEKVKTPVPCGGPAFSLRCQTSGSLTMWLDHVLAAAGLLGKRDGLDLLLRDPLVEHLGVGAPDALREVEVAPVLDRGASSREERDQQDGEKMAWGEHLIHGCGA